MRLLTAAVCLHSYLGDGGRLSRLLKVVDATIAACGKGGNFSCGDKPCYVDYFVLNNQKVGCGLVCVLLSAARTNLVTCFWLAASGLPVR